MLPFPVGRLVRRPHMQPIGAVTKKEPKTDLRMQPIGAVTKKEPKTETALRTVSAGVKRKQSDVIPIGAVPSAGIQCKRSDVIPIGAVPSAGVQCKRSNGIPIQAVPSAGVECKRSDVIPIGAVRKYQPSHTTPIGAATNRQHVDMKSANAEEIPHGRLRRLLGLLRKYSDQQGLRFLPLGACSISEKFAYTYGADKQMIGI
ncbi:unnamed protein product [Symbiodinium natans]|uniref:Uncharacterized protein n=1 Tax=Symbiodinium natans TaxID=878477 RepID=A0A812JZ57_9DINO|nr:unnamed protein product [Symbiodinium natans]